MCIYIYIYIYIYNYYYYYFYFYLFFQLSISQRFQNLHVKMEKKNLSNKEKFIKILNKTLSAKSKLKKLYVCVWDLILN